MVQGDEKRAEGEGQQRGKLEPSMSLGGITFRLDELTNVGEGGEASTAWPAGLRARMHGGAPAHRKRGWPFPGALTCQRHGRWRAPDGAPVCVR